MCNHWLLNVKAGYSVVELDGEYYLIEDQHGFIYQIGEDGYTELELLFN